jgi:hypothetical protein
LLRSCGSERQFVADGSGGLLEDDLLMQEEALERSHQIVDQMPPVRHLNSLGRAAARAVSVESGAVPTHYNDPRMRSQPGCHRLSRAVRQQVDEAMALEVAEQRTIAMAAPPRPVVDAEHGRRWVGAGQWAGLHQFEDRLAASAHAQALT